MKNTSVMLSRGWVKCPRAVLAHPVSHNPRLLALWLTLTLLAPPEGGEVRMTLVELARQTGLGRHGVAGAVERLRSMGLVDAAGVDDDGLWVVMPPAMSAGAGVAAVEGCGAGVPTASDGLVRPSDGLRRPCGGLWRPEGGLGRPSHSSLIYREERKEDIYSSSSFGESMLRVFAGRGGV